jgi:hypothetical protein
MRKILVPFWGCCADGGQVVPWASWEVVVFNVVADVKVRDVPNAKVVV